MPADFTPRSLMETMLDSWPEHRDYISPSQLKMFARCPEQFRRHYILGENQRPGAAMVWGSADHAAVEENFKQKVYSREDLRVDEVKVIFAAKLDEKIEKEGGLAEVEWDKERPNLTVNDAKKEAASVKDRGVELVSLYHSRVSPLLQPVETEKKFTVEVPGVPVPITGIIDVRARPWTGDGPELPPFIVERKTAGNNKVNMEWLVQGRVYQLVHPEPIDYQLSLRQGARRKNPAVVFGDHIYPVKPLPMMIAQIRRTVAGISTAYAMYGPDEPWPDALGHSWACDFCGFRPTCPWWSSTYWKQQLEVRRPA